MSRVDVRYPINDVLTLDKLKFYVFFYGQTSEEMLANFDNVIAVVKIKLQSS